MEQSRLIEIEEERKQYETWEGRELLQRYHDILMNVLQARKTSSLTAALAVQYAGIQQEVLRRLDQAMQDKIL